MSRNVTRALTASIVTMVVVGLAPAASAHEGRTHGDLEMVVGFGTEPAYAGQPNSVQLTLSHGGEPVVGSCSGNWISAGSFTSPNVRGPDVNVSSISSSSMVPVKWNVY